MSSPKNKGKQSREPPPSLFLGPPSNNASRVSLPGVAPVSVPTSSTLRLEPLERQRTQLSSPLNTSNTALPRQIQDSENKKQADRTDALWAEMQSTLQEVELSAVSGTHVFGQEHAKALDGLRKAQIELAQAWARSEADDVVQHADKESKGLSGSKNTVLGSEGKSVLDNTVGSTGASGSNRPGSSGHTGAAPEVMGAQLEEETRADILLARKRREANDIYFKKVNEGVLEVVSKLEEVAAAMKAVEQESRSIWGDTESSRTNFHEGHERHDSNESHE